MTLKDNVHVLTRPHLTTADDGSLIHAPALLAELRAACVSNLGAQGGGSGGGGMILNSKAVKIETGIKEEALNEHFEMTGKEYQGRIVDLIQSWADLNGDYEEYLGRITLEWIDAIRGMLEAKRPPWRPSMPCPACSQRFYGAEREPCIAVYFWDDEAEAVAPPNKWFAECEGCGAEWAGDNLKWLRAASDTPTLSVAEVA